MIEEDDLRWASYDPGDMTNAFDSKDDIYKLLNILKTYVFTENEWEWRIDE